MKISKMSLFLALGLSLAVGSTGWGSNDVPITGKKAQALKKADDAASPDAEPSAAPSDAPKKSKEKKTKKSDSEDAASK